MPEPLTRLEGVDGGWFEVVVGCVGACVVYVAFCVTVQTLAAVPDARTLEAKSAITKRVKADVVKRDGVCAILAFDEKWWAGNPT